MQAGLPEVQLVESCVVDVRAERLRDVKAVTQGLGRLPEILLLVADEMFRHRDDACILHPLDRFRYSHAAQVWIGTEPFCLCVRSRSATAGDKASGNSPSQTRPLAGWRPRGPIAGPSLGAISHLLPNYTPRMDRLTGHQRLCHSAPMRPAAPFHTTARDRKTRRRCRRQETWKRNHLQFKDVSKCNGLV